VGREGLQSIAVRGGTSYRYTEGGAIPHGAILVRAIQQEGRAGLGSFGRVIRRWQYLSSAHLAIYR